MLAVVCRVVLFVVEWFGDVLYCWSCLLSNTVLGCAVVLVVTCLVVQFVGICFGGMLNCSWLCW